MKETEGGGGKLKETRKGKCEKMLGKAEGNESGVMGMKFWGGGGKLKEGREHKESEKINYKT